MSLRDYMRKTGFSRAVAGAVGGHRLGAGAGDRGRRARRRSSVSAFNLPSQYNTDTTRSIAQRLAAALGVQLHASCRSRRSTTGCARCSRQHAHPIAQQPDAREPPRAHPRPADDGGVERHRRAAHLLRQRDRDRARLRDALRRHVRRHVAHRRPLEDRRLPPGALRQPQARARDHPGRHLHDQAVGGARRRPVRSVRLRGRRRRSSASWSSAAPARPSSCALLRTPRARSGALQARRRGPHAVRQAHAPRPSARSSTDASRRMRRSVYKRLQGPPIVVVSERAFGFDLRETIINGWEG